MKPHDCPFSVGECQCPLEDTLPERFTLPARNGAWDLTQYPFNKAELVKAVAESTKEKA